MVGPWEMTEADHDARDPLGHSVSKEGLQACGAGSQESGKGEMEVCGIDPGLETTGYAVLAIDGDNAVIRDAGVCRTDTGVSLPDRLAQINADLDDLFQQFKPYAVGVEELYAHYKHPRTAILMGHARGVILAAAARHGIIVHSFNATQVKRFLTGNGRASKAQMQRAVMASLRLATPPEPNDVADALAIAMRCADECRRHQPEIART